MRSFPDLSGALNDGALNDGALPRTFPPGWADALPGGTIKTAEALHVSKISTPDKNGDDDAGQRQDAKGQTSQNRQRQINTPLGASQGHQMVAKQAMRLLDTGRIDLPAQFRMRGQRLDLRQICGFGPQFAGQLSAHIVKQV